jgi:hypothetical protein
MIHVPGLTDQGLETLEYTEHIDLYPTLAEVGPLHTPPPRRPCYVANPRNDAPHHTLLHSFCF